MENELVRYSRAGDAFHYRWAARRCLRLIEPHSSLKCITIESSKESKAQGEYVIDLAEYSEIEDGRQSVGYFQLKHTTTRTRKAFARSEIAKTLKAFAKRYSALFRKPRQRRPNGPVTFSFVTNRPINKALKQAVLAIAQGSKADRQSQKQLEQTTGLRDGHLQAFCASLSLVDGEGDYIVQKEQLKKQMSEYIAGFVDSQEVDAIISMVADRALPKSEDGKVNGEISREDVLKRFGVSSERDLFPAPAKFEELLHTIKREQHDEILRHIIAATGPTIIHAAGGVGKSVVARQLAQSLPRGSQGFVYDCFGGGKYRNPSEPRHRACDALIQLANEMASRGLCRPLIGHPGKPTDSIFRAFLERLKQASECLREIDPNAQLILLIDAADNAELVAEEYGDRCFAHELLREKLPTGCRLVMFCRTERIGLLKPKTGKERFELRPFSNEETAAHLRQTYPGASDRDCLEFHRLTGGNPRVQANALAQGKNVEEVLSQLGPNQATVAAQLASQLDAAISAVKDRHINQSQIDAICYGLASLPPFVPLEVLARAADVDVSAVRSFIGDLGRPLWHTDDAVQFRDEPTETWFRDRFGASKAQIIAYLAALEPLAKQYTYVAKVLPQLLLKSENYDRLVSLALSDDLLPENNAIDERDIRLYRLQFAFKAALRLGRYADAARLAFRAGEEAAGNERQLSLLQANVHLIAPLQGAHRIQEIAYRQVFRSAWEGSQNVFSASLLSAVKDFHGEARTYLRASQKWLGIYFAEREKKAKAEKERPSFGQDQLQDADIAELGWAYLNLYGPSDTVRFLLKWRPPEVTFRVTCLLISRLVDAARLEEIDEIARKGAGSIYLMLAVADELMAVARFPPKDALRRALGLLAGKSTRIPKSKQAAFEDKLTPAIESLVEACAAKRLSRKKIDAILRFYAPAVADWSVGSNTHGESRRTFLRGVALRAVLQGKQGVVPSSLLPRKKAKKNGHGGRDREESEERDITQCISALLPWYILRAHLLATDASVGQKEMEHAVEFSEKALRERYRTYEPLPWEISRVRFDLLALNIAASSSEIGAFIDYLKAAKQFSLQNRLEAARAVFRLTHLHELREPLEMSCRDTIEGPGNEGPDERASWFTSLARAVLPTSTSDAAAYFNQAVEAVSKFGDEMVERWEAVVEVARRASENRRSTPETTYRFVRCAEMIGETVAREKYWDRDNVFRVAVNLDAPSAFAALSRWRDRDVGAFDRQLLALASEAVEAEILSPSVAWCLSGSEGCNGSVEFAAICIQREPRSATQQRMLDSAIRDLELAGTSLGDLRKLEAVADAAHLSKAKLNRLIEAYASVIGTSATTPRVPVIPVHARSKGPQHCVDECLNGVDLLTPEGLGKALDNFRTTEPPREFELFWKEVVRRVPPGREAEFLPALILGPELDSYDIREAVRQIRTNWLGKAAIKNAWPTFLKKVGKRLAMSLSRHGSLAYFRSESRLDGVEVAAIKSGLIEGLAESSELMDASTFFGFVGRVVDRLSTDEASDLLDYALTRFEIHIEDDHADGLWSEWLRPSVDVCGAVVGLIWSALGSPYSSTRWEAAHCVQRLAENLCEREITLLIGSMQDGGVGPFGSHRFPFYDLHAKLYLLIALVRASVDDSTVLKPHASIFAQIALEGSPHILIQKTAADIALAIERGYPLSYGADVVARLQKVGTSPLPAKIAESYQYQVTTPWHADGQVDLKLDLRFGYDFDRYWLTPLGSLFGISEKEIVELARDTSIHSLRIPNAEAYPKDPRQKQWEALNRFDGRYNTWHDHGSYPRVDDYTFYYSYHACLAVAAKLLAKMQVVRHTRNSYEENRWEDWLARYLLTRSDRKWLADRRDATPIHERAWVNNSEREHWEWGIAADDFVEMLRQQSSLHGSLCVSGHWMECDSSCEESVYIESALVNPVSAESVATTLRISDETHWSALPRFGDEESESSKSSADLTGWIHHYEYHDQRLDGFDPYAREIRYPPREIGKTFLSLLSLSPDSERREWRLPNASNPSLICEVWSDKALNERDKPHRFGERIQASAQLLMMLCRKTQKDLLFEVRIERRRDRRYSPASKEEMGLIPPSRKLFILSSDGVLRDKHRRYQLG